MNECKPLVMGALNRKRAISERVPIPSGHPSAGGGGGGGGGGASDRRMTLRCGKCHTCLNRQLKKKCLNNLEEDPDGGNAGIFSPPPGRAEAGGEDFGVSDDDDDDADAAEVDDDDTDDAEPAAKKFKASPSQPRVRPGRCSSPHHSTHFESSLLVFTSIL